MLCDTCPHVPSRRDVCYPDYLGRPDECFDLLTVVAYILKQVSTGLEY